VIFLWLYWLLLLSCCALAAFSGGRSGQWGCAIMLTGSGASLAAAWANPRWTDAPFLVFWVDVACSLAFIALALWSPRYWPIWAASFQLVATLFHLARFVSPHVSPMVYQALQTMWTIPLIVVMALGIMLDHRRGL